MVRDVFSRFIDYFHFYSMDTWARTTSYIFSKSVR